MRTYFVFNVNKPMSILAKDSPYMLYKSFESIYKSNKNEFSIASNLYEQIACKLNKTIINQKIISNNKNNDHYIYINNQHNYYNKYKDETCNVKVNNSYLLCKSNTHGLLLLKCLNTFNFFVCDFENKDYFWLDELYC